MLDVGMVTGDGVAEGDGPPGEFIVWMIRKRRKEWSDGPEPMW